MIAETALFQKELATNFRGKKPFWSLVLSSLGCALLLVLLWPKDSNSIHSKQMFIWSIRYIIPLILGLFFFGTTISISSLCATLITQERENGTFDLLRGTFLNASRIFLGKYLAVLFYIIVLFSILLPVIATILSAGWISIEQFAKFFVIFLTTSSLNIIISLWLSASQETSTNAVRKASSYSILCLFGFGFLGYAILSLTILLLREFFSFKSVFLYKLSEIWLPLTVPFSSIYDIFYSGINTPLFPSLTTIPRWAFNPIFFSILSLFFFLLGVRKIDQEGESLPKTKKNKKEKRLPRIARIQKKIEQTEDAVFQKELLLFPQSRKIIRVAKIMVFFAFMLFCITLIHNEPLDFRIPFGWQLFIFTTLTITAPATSLSKEINSDNFAMLRSTLITPKQFLWGKFKANLFLLAPVLIFFMAGNYFCINQNTRPAMTFFPITICNLLLSLNVMFSLMLALAAGSFATKIDVAGRVGMLLYLLCYIGISIGLYLLVAFILSSQMLEQVAPWINIFSPFLILVNLFSRQGDFQWISFVLHLAYLSICFYFSYLTAKAALQSKWLDS